MFNELKKMMHEQNENNKEIENIFFKKQVLELKKTIIELKN